MPLTFDQAMAFGRGVPQIEARYSGSIANAARLMEEKRRNQELEKAARLQRVDAQEQRRYARAEAHRQESDAILGELEKAADAEDWDSVERLGGALTRLGYGFSKEGDQPEAPPAQPQTMVEQATNAGGSLFDRAMKGGKGILDSVGGFLYPDAMSKPPDPAVDSGTAVGKTFDQAAQSPFDRAASRAKGVLKDLAPGEGGSASVRVPVEETPDAKGVAEETRVDPRELGSYVVRAADGSEVVRIAGAKQREQNRINFDRVSSAMVNGLTDDPDLQKDVRIAAELVRSQNLPIEGAKKELGRWIERLAGLSASERRAELMASVSRARISIGQQVSGEDNADDYIKGGRYGMAQMKGQLTSTVESFAAIREMMENAAANNGLANSAASYKGARAMQGTGPITDSDIKNLSVKDQTVGAAIAHKVNYVLPGLMAEGLSDDEIQSRLNFTDDERRVMAEFGRIRMRQIQQRAIEQEAGLHETWSRMPPSQQRDGFRDAAVGMLQQVPGLLNKPRWGLGGGEQQATPAPEGKKFEEMTPAEQDAEVRKQFE
jgi:hypothetical protein